MFAKFLPAFFTSTSFPDSATFLKYWASLWNWKVAPCKFLQWIFQFCFYFCLFGTFVQWPLWKMTSHINETLFSQRKRVIKGRKCNRQKFKSDYLTLPLKAHAPDKTTERYKYIQFLWILLLPKICCTGGVMEIFCGK